MSNPNLTPSDQYIRKVVSRVLFACKGKQSSELKKLANDTTALQEMTSDVLDEACGLAFTLEIAEYVIEYVIGRAHTVYDEAADLAVARFSS